VNGGGIYTEENGHQGVSEYEFVVARFINEVDETGAPFVEWEGRSQVVGGYGTNSGGIQYAAYGSGDGETPHYNVTHVSETGTVPTFTLVSATDPTHPFLVTGDQLYNLRLVLTTNYARAYFQSTLFFKPLPPDLQTVPIYGTTRSFHRYALYGYFGTDPLNIPNAVSYCQRALPAGTTSGARADDYVVFQQGIAVDLLTAKTTFGQDQTVTMSCSGGAIATAMMWGYPYLGVGKQGETIFEAAMHMKRASYCGDVTTYTQAGTKIAIDDIVPIHSEPRITNTNVEARWGRWPDGHVGALCVNPSRERHPGLLYPLTGSGLPFEGWCYPDDGSAAFQIPVCTVIGRPTQTVMSDSPNLRVL
jgi:hypothetical protein